VNVEEVETQRERLPLTQSFLQEMEMDRLVKGAGVAVLQPVPGIESIHEVSGLGWGEWEWEWEWEERGEEGRERRCGCGCGSGKRRRGERERGCVCVCVCE
jgi:hypothetical protein